MQVAQDISQIYKNKLSAISYVENSEIGPYIIGKYGESVIKLIGSSLYFVTTLTNQKRKVMVSSIENNFSSLRDEKITSFIRETLKNIQVRK